MLLPKVQASTEGLEHTYGICSLLPQMNTLGYHILQGKNGERWERLGQGTLEKAGQLWVCARCFVGASMGFSLWVDPVRKTGWFYLWGLKALNRREGRLDTVYWSISGGHLWQTAKRTLGVLSVLRHAYRVILAWSWSITVAGGPVWCRCSMKQLCLTERILA